MVKDKRIEVEENKIALQGNKNHMYLIREKILRYMNDKDMTQDEFSEYAGTHCTRFYTSTRTILNSALQFV